MKYVVLIAATVALAGCEQPASSDSVVAAGTEGMGMPIYTDPLTGCDYIVPTGIKSYGVMPRMASDGYTVLCADQKAALK